MGRFLGKVLCSDTRGDTLKFINWAIDLHNGRPLELDESDYLMLKTYVDKCERMQILVRGRILNVFNDTQPEDSEKKNPVTA